MTLDELPVGKCARIATVNGQGAFRRRLMELGLLPGTDIERVGQSPFGDPLTYRVRGAKLALRRTDASIVEVESER